MSASPKTMTNKPATRKAPARKPAETSKADVFETVTAQLLAAMESAQGNWRKPWLPASFASCGLAHNAQTGIEYKGGNAVILGMLGGGQWATYKQWQDLGAQVRKGEKAIPCVKWLPMRITDKKTEQDKDIMIPRCFSVFRFDQVDGYTVPETITRPDIEKHAQAQAIVDSTGARIYHSEQNSAFYRPSTDAIHMPALHQWATQGEYYGTLLHELTHWTGHETRLSRISSGLGIRHSSDEYAREELVAEIGAALLLAHCGLSVTPREDHALYLNSWIRQIRNEPRAFFTAASKAQKAVDFILPSVKTDGEPDTQDAPETAQLSFSI